MYTNNRTPRFRFTSLVFVSLLSFLSISACSEDNPVDSHDHEHFEPVGLILSDDGTEIVRVENGEVTGQISLQKDVLSPHYELVFIDEDGDTGLPDDSDFSLNIELNDAPLEVEKDEPEDWEFHLKGTEVGTYTIRIAIKHGSHNDFESPDITVTVSE